MKVEIIHTAGCETCTAAREKLRTVAQQTVVDLDWREIDIREALDYAVGLGVLTLPAVAINGKLVFSTMPTETQLAQALRLAAGKG
jgi:thioredoxin 1